MFGTGHCLNLAQNYLGRVRGQFGLLGCHFGLRLLLIDNTVCDSYVEVDTLNSKRKYTLLDLSSTQKVADLR